MKIYKKTEPAVYTLLQPEKSIPLIFDSSHSGKTMPDDFNYACDELHIQQSIEHFVDELFQQTALENGATFLKAEFPRSYIDPNRSEIDIDLDLLEDKWPYPTDPDGRSHLGIGLIRRLIKPGINLYTRKLTAQEIQNRIEKYYQPYHQILAQTINDLKQQHGQVFHIDLHSMPSTLTSTSGLPISNCLPDFVLSDRGGQTCDINFIYALKDILKDEGFTVTINTPYRGAEIIKRCGDPTNNIHSVQLETNRSLFLNEKTCQKSKLFDRFQEKVKRVTRQILT